MIKVRSKRQYNREAVSTVFSVCSRGPSHPQPTNPTPLALVSWIIPVTWPTLLTDLRSVHLSLNKLVFATYLKTSSQFVAPFTIGFVLHPTVGLGDKNTFSRPTEVLVLLEL